MTSRRRVALLTGAVVVGIYLGLAALSGHLSPFARRPMLDGGPGVIQPYRWVSPPPGLEKTNKRPLSRRVRLGLTARGSQPNVVETTDLQCAIVLTPGAVASAPGQRDVLVTITPLAPAGFASALRGYSIIGNVYSIQARYEPSGTPVLTLAAGSRLLLTYPATSSVGAHILLEAHDRKTWQRLRAVDSQLSQQITGLTRTLGFFAVGAPGLSSPVAGGAKKSTSVVLWILLGLAGAIALGLAALGIASRRRNRRRTSPRHRTKPPPRRPERW